jgi:hypothetical protein
VPMLGVILTFCLGRVDLSSSAAGPLVPISPQAVRDAPHAGAGNVPNTGARTKCHIWYIIIVQAVLSKSHHGNTTRLDPLRST